MYKKSYIPGVIKGRLACFGSFTSGWGYPGCPASRVPNLLVQKKRNSGCGVVPARIDRGRSCATPENYNPLGIGFQAEPGFSNKGLKNPGSALVQVLFITCFGGYRA
jgi:hypothetical protein